MEEIDLNKAEKLNIKQKSDEYFMKEAKKETKKAYQKNEVPVGAVVVKNNEIVARGHNIKETKKDTTKHAEIIAIQKASKKMNAWRLEDCTMYVTLEPCTMCAGAIIQARLKRLIIGTMDKKTGACGSVLNLIDDYEFNHKGQYFDEKIWHEGKEYSVNFNFSDVSKFNVYDEEDSLVEKEIPFLVLKVENDEGVVYNIVENI